MVDGQGCTVQGNGSGTGIDLSNRNNVTIKNTTIKKFYYGIYLSSSSNNTFSGNDITNNTGPGIFGSWGGIGLFGSSDNNSISGNKITAYDGYGIWLDYYSDYNSISGNNIANNGNGIHLDHSSDNTLSGNNVTANNGYGIRLYYSSDNALSGNNIAYNGYGIRLDSSSDNIFCHNNFVANTQQVNSASSANVWDDGYPSGGNYWSDYDGTDLLNGTYRNETGSDGIGDAEYAIDGNNTDHYPLMAPISFFDAGTWNDTTYYVNIVSNSTVSHFYFNPDEGAFARFWVKGETETETFGFCRVAIPKDLLWVEDGWTVLYGSYSLSYKAFSDENYTYLYFTYTNPSQNGFTTVMINGTHVIPEFPPFLILPLFMIVTLLAVIVYKRKKANRG